MKRFPRVEVKQLSEVAAWVISLLPEYPVWVVSGPMGAGKTTLIREIGRQLGVTDPMGSPTFAIIHEYHVMAGMGKMIHFDFYRINGPAEAWDLGAEEYFHSGYPCFIEWPERIPGLLPDQYGIIRITPVSEDERDIEVSIHHE